MADQNAEPEVEMICYSPLMVESNGIWLKENPLEYSFPVFILQVIMVVLTTRLLVYALRPFHQPRVISEILGGIILGPSVLGKNMKFAITLFPETSTMLLETMANVGLLYFLFLVGVEMDISVVWHTGKKAVAIAIAGMLLPFVVGCSFSFLLHDKASNTEESTFILFLALALSVTAFPVLARVLAELKLLNTEIGRIAMSSALISNICVWVLLAFAIALTEKQTASMSSVWVILSNMAFIVFCLFVVQPAISWMIKRTPEGEVFSEFSICLILAGVMISGFITDSLGTHFIFGPFVFGLIIPNGPLGITIIEKLEDFVSGLLLPLFFAISGLKTNINSIEGAFTWARLIVVILLAGAGKIAGTVLVARFYDMPLREAVTLGLLMNTKGLIGMIVLNVGRDQKAIDDRTFAILVILSVIMTGIITPIVMTIYRPERKFLPYKRRTIQNTKPDTELPILVCIHTSRNVPPIISLLKASHPTKKSPVCVFVLHLVELTGRASSMLIIHTTQKSDRPAVNTTQSTSDHIINAFENFEHGVGCVSVQSLTAMSPYSTMHEDICNVAEDKRVAFIIIPFHKQLTVDDVMEATNPKFQIVNQNVLANASCSVGILVDRGLSGSTRLAANQVSHHIAVLFCSGPDDREALSYALRMSENPGNSLTVIRFVPGANAVKSAMEPSQSGARRLLTVQTDNEREKQLDDDFIEEVKMMKANDKSFAYMEKVVNNEEETVAAIRSVDIHDLFIVGRGQGMMSPLMAGLTEWNECPELGPIGDLLASSDFAATVSVLVMKQYIAVGPHSEEIGALDTPGHQEEKPVWD